MTRGDIKRVVLSKLAGDNYFPDQQLNDLITVAIDIIGAKTPFRQDMVAFMSASGRREYNLPHNIMRVQTVEYNNCPGAKRVPVKSKRDGQYNPVNPCPINSAPPPFPLNGSLLVPKKPKV